MRPHRRPRFARPKCRPAARRLLAYGGLLGGWSSGGSGFLDPGFWILDPRILDSRDSKVSGEKVAAQQSVMGETEERVHRTPMGLEARGEPDRTAELARSHGSETNDIVG